MRSIKVLHQGGIAMNLSKQIKRKYHFKYITLFCLLLLFLPLLGIIATQFIHQDLYPVCVRIFIILLALDFFLMHIYYKILLLPTINTYDILLEYLNYFSSDTIKDLEYTEAITWFSELVRSAYKTKDGTFDQQLTDIINKLYYILRPNDHNISDALSRKSGFIKLTKQVIDGEDITESIRAFRDLKVEKYTYTPDKNMFIYIVFIIIHIFGCFLLTKSENSPFNIYSFLGNVCMYIPADIAVILVYKGILKSSNN